MSYAFTKASNRPLTKTELNDMLRQAVANTPPAEPDKEADR